MLRFIIVLLILAILSESTLSEANRAPSPNTNKRRIRSSSRPKLSTPSEEAQNNSEEREANDQVADEVMCTNEQTVRDVAVTKEHRREDPFVNLLDLFQMSKAELKSLQFVYSTQITIPSFLNNLTSGELFLPREIDSKHICPEACSGVCSTTVDLKPSIIANPCRILILNVEIFEPHSGPPTFFRTFGRYKILENDASAGIEINQQAEQTKCSPTMDMLFLFWNSSDALELLGPSPLKVNRNLQKIQLHLVKILDYEERTNYSFIIYSCWTIDLNPISCTQLKAFIEVVDQNEFTPEISYVYLTTDPINETDPISSTPSDPVRVILLNASDQDKDDSASLEFFIASIVCNSKGIYIDPSTCQNMFYYENKTLAPLHEKFFIEQHGNGAYVIAKHLDYEDCREYELEIIVKDKGGRQKGVFLRVAVADLPDNEPCIQFSPDNNKVSIKENILLTKSEKNYEVENFEIKVRDPDFDIYKKNAIIRCTLYDGQTDATKQLFELKEINQPEPKPQLQRDESRYVIFKLYAKGTFDRETTSLIKLVVVCTDRSQARIALIDLNKDYLNAQNAIGGDYELDGSRLSRRRNEFSAARIYVNIIDENEFTPTFEKASYTFELTENNNKDFLVGTVHAYDEDGGLMSIFGKLF